MLELFYKGGPIMWPLLICSLVTLTVVLERAYFCLTESRAGNPALLRQVLDHATSGDAAAALQAANGSADPVVRVVASGLEFRDRGFASAILEASQRELARYDRGITVLDTIITLAPLLGLLGTVTGMIRTFGLLGGAELGAPQAVTGGIAEALIATAFGLGIAITALLPFNYLNSRMERVRREIESAASRLELAMA